MSLLFDTGFLTGEITEIEDSSSADGATLVDVDLLDERAADGEDTLHTYAVGDFTDSKGLSSPIRNIRWCGNGGDETYSNNHNSRLRHNNCSC